MSVNSTVASQYVRDARPRAVKRRHMLHDLYSPAGHRALVAAGLQPGMKIADFGCGVGAVTRMLADMTGPAGSVTGIDVDPGQVREARTWCASASLQNVSFLRADACRTGLPRASYDLVYCRFLLLHLSDPMECLHEMRDVLRPGGIVVVEEGDLASATSVPPTAMNAFGDLFCRFAPTLGLDCSLARTLYHKVVRAGFCDVNVEIHQPAIARGENRLFLKWSVEEAAPAFLDAGVVTCDDLERTLHDMQEAIDDPDVLILAPRMSSVWGRKPATA